MEWADIRIPLLGLGDPTRPKDPVCWMLMLMCFVGAPMDGTKP